MQEKNLSLDTLLAVAVFTLVLLLVIPLPPLVLDLLLCFNLVLSVMTLLLTLYVEKALEFSAFPSLLLFLTLFRLGLNVASTRMILTQGTAGALIATFGEFVTSGNLFVGIVIFFLLTSINFFVVTKGAGRVAEVAARFMLEALPGKQMAIDSDLQAGALSNDEARAARLEVSREAEFYGAMDGASKFVKGDAIAGIMITGINAVGGLILGVCLQGISLVDSLSLFTRLTVGDGLVSQIPALLISIGAGIMVTRASHESVASSFRAQLFNHPKVFLYTGVSMALLGLVPGMPIVVLFPMGGALFLYSRVLSKHAKESSIKKGSSRLELFLGSAWKESYSLFYLELPNLSESLSRKMGVAFPLCSFHFSENLKPHESVLLFRDVQIMKSSQEEEIGSLLEKIENHLITIAPQLIHRQWVSEKVAEVKKYNKAVVEELIPHKLNIGALTQLLIALTKEQVPIKDMDLILESAANFFATDRGLWTSRDLCEHVRRSLKTSFTQYFFGSIKEIQTIRIDPKVEQMIAAGVKEDQVTLRAACVEQIYAHTEKLVTLKSDGKPLVVVTAPRVRSSLRQLLESRFPHLPVIAHDEIDEDLQQIEVGSLGREVL